MLTSNTSMYVSSAAYIKAYKGRRSSYIVFLSSAVSKTVNSFNIIEFHLDI
jgi:hypothetical protein